MPPFTTTISREKDVGGGGSFVPPERALIEPVCDGGSGIGGEEEEE